MRVLHVLCFAMLVISVLCWITYVAEILSKVVVLCTIVLCWQVGQALSLASSNTTTWTPPPAGNPHPVMGGLSAEFHAQQQAQQHAMMQQMSSMSSDGMLGSASKNRVYLCTKDDTLRTVVEKLAVPGVRRLVVVHPETRRVEGLISLSDVASYLFL